MKKSLFFLTVFVFVFTGCSSSMNSLRTDLSNNVRGVFLTEEDLKVGVKEAYITEDTDAKSKIVRKVKLDEELKIIGLKENENWFKVLTKDSEGYIPRSAMIEVSVSDELGKSLGTLWEKVKGEDSKAKTTFDSKKKDWTDTERERRHVKGFTKSAKKEDKKSKVLKVRYDEKYMDRFFASIDGQMTQKSVQGFRKIGGLK